MCRVGRYIIWHAVWFKRTLAYYGVLGETQLGEFTVGTLFRVSIIAGSVFLTCRLISLMSGIGLFKIKERARMNQHQLVSEMKVWLR